MWFARSNRFIYVINIDTGGGNALNVQRTVKDLIAAGAAGCFLEVDFVINLYF